jgi:hypothetical protein
VLVERIPERADAVVHGEHENPVAVAVERLAGPQLDELDRVRHLAEDAAQAPEQLPEPDRPVDGERDLALPQLERLQHSRQAEIVVGVEVADEDLFEVR